MVIVLNNSRIQNKHFPMNINERKTPSRDLYFIQNYSNCMPKLLYTVTVCLSEEEDIHSLSLFFKDKEYLNKKLHAGTHCLSE